MLSTDTNRSQPTNSTLLPNRQTRFPSKCVSASEEIELKTDQADIPWRFVLNSMFELSDPNLNPRRFTLFPSTTHFITKDHKRRMKGWFDRVSWRKPGRNKEESLPFFFLLLERSIILLSWTFGYFHYLHVDLNTALVCEGFKSICVNISACRRSPDSDQRIDCF